MPTLEKNARSSTVRIGKLLATASVLAAGLASTHAQAATVQNFTINRAIPFNNVCLLDVSFDLTGVNDDDGGGNDFIQLSVTNTSGQRFAIPPLFFSQMGSTRQLIGAQTAIPASAGPGSYEVRVIDVNAITTFNGVGTTIATAPIPLSVLTAAGGPCSSLVAPAPPTVDAGPLQTVTGSTQVSLGGSATDPNNDPLTLQWTQVSGPSVTLAGANSLAPTFIAPVQTTVDQTLVFELSANDGSGPVTDQVSVVISANQGPTAVIAGPTSAQLGTTFTLDGTGSSDPDNDALSYAWIQLTGPTAVRSTPTNSSTDITLPAGSSQQAFSFQLLVTDPFGVTAQSTINVAGLSNTAPSVNAGTDQTVAGSTAVNFAGTATDVDLDPLTVHWTQVGGPSVTLNGANTLTPSFNAVPRGASDQLLTFELSADDGTVTSSDQITVTVLGNQAPVADVAGPSSGAGGSQITLDGTGSSDPESDPLNYRWVQVSGPAATINSPTASSTSIVLPSPAIGQQALVFQLTVTDNFDASNAQQFTVTVPANNRPNVDAGAIQTVPGGSNVTLAATASDPENDPLTYSWVQFFGPPVILSNNSDLTPSFTAPAATGSQQLLIFELTANDGLQSVSDIAEVIIAANDVPVANAGAAQDVSGGDAVMLDGSGSMDANGDPLTYQWVQTSGPTVNLSDATSISPNFIAPPAASAAQVLTFDLVVNDGAANSVADSVTVSILANIVPVANAGADQDIADGGTVTLDGSGSTDADGDPLTYLWVQTGGPTVTLNDASAVSPSFAAPPATSATQALTFDLVVSDGIDSSPADSVTVTVLANNPPVADAGGDIGPIDSGQTVSLDGSASSDPDGDSLTYSWSQVSGTAVSLVGANTASPTFVAPLVNSTEDLVFELVVNDGTVSSPADQITVNIRAVGSITIIQQVIGRDTTVTFSSNVAGLNSSITTSGGTGQFSAARVAAGNYSISAADLSAQGYALTSIVCNDSDSVVNLAALSVALDLSPSEDLVCTFSMTNSRDAATTAISDFLTGRNALIMAHQPDLQRRLDRLQSAPGTSGSVNAGGLAVPIAMPFNMSLNSGQGSVSTSLATVAAATGEPDRGRQAFDIWAEAYFSRARIGNQEADFRIFHIGADYRLSDTLLVGLLAEFDQFDDRESLGAGEAEGDGWLVGPYALAKIGPNLFGEVRAAWGRSENSVSPFGTYIDEFETSRSFYSGSLIGQFDLGKDTTIRPEVTIRYLSEEAKTYTDSLNIIIPGQMDDQGDLSFRPRIQHRIELDGGWAIRPFGEVEGIYTFGTDINTVLDNGLRARFEGGLDVFSSGSFRASASAFHDGIGTDNYRSTGAHVSVSFGF